jgi:phage terminase small subunit
MPARQPRSVKAFKGTLQPCRDRPELELPPVSAVPEPPAFLDVCAAQEFDRVAGMLFRIGALSDGDLGLLTAYAATWSGLVKQWENHVRPTAAELTAFRQIASELGLSPRSRASLPPPNNQAPHNPFARLGNPFARHGKRPANEFDEF